MTRTVTATEAKARLPALLDEVARGEEIEITKHGRVVARLISGGGARGIVGRFEGVVVSTPDDAALLSTGLEWDVR